MAKFVIECFDERGNRLEAHCEQSSGDPHYRFTSMTTAFPMAGIYPHSRSAVGWWIVEAISAVQLPNESPPIFWHLIGTLYPAGHTA